MMLFNLSGHGFKIAYKEEKQVEPFFWGFLEAIHVSSSCRTCTRKFAQSVTMTPAMFVGGVRATPLVLSM
jgi:hypothetical protein